uniref:Uncharacterized protein n=1 Tax=Magallana gigas TaxID=29159 RepID=K1Q512_MAGGI
MKIPNLVEEEGVVDPGIYGVVEADPVQEFLYSGCDGGSETQNVIKREGGYLIDGFVWVGGRLRGGGGYLFAGFVWVGGRLRKDSGVARPERKCMLKMTGSGVTMRPPVGEFWWGPRGRRPKKLMDSDDF